MEPLEGAQCWDILTSVIWSPGLREDRLLLFQACVCAHLSLLPQETHAAGGKCAALI